jgi:hypothetical protein
MYSINFNFQIVARRMKFNTHQRTILLSLLFALPSFLFAFTTGGPDTCTVNDDCQQAILIPNIVSDLGFVCIAGCNMYASPDTLIESCQLGDFPTVWYKFSVEQEGIAMNISVTSTEFDAPVISLFKGQINCGGLQQVFFSGGNMACAIGTEGLVEVTGVPIEDSTFYYLAISSLFSIGGDFELCISTLSTGFICVQDRDIEITARSNGGPLEGPFDPAETVSICFNVNSFSAANNGCQWFQGLVPVFGNGWDPASFDAHGQPLKATINGKIFGEPGNGNYSTSLWDWFDDVDYHFDNPNLTIADLDNNGTLDMCSSLYETDCPQTGIDGACCNPCWSDTAGDTLPGGWFAYGIDGSCPGLGPPIRLDWGDGNTCGGGMGPWSFCFDLTTRDIADCMGDTTRKDLSIGFFTFADGETGAWTGNASVCAYDTPAKLSLKAKCGRISTSDVEILGPFCPGDTLQYPLQEEGVTPWEWNISPFWAAPALTNTGDNNAEIQTPLINTTEETVDVTGVMIGRQTGSEDIVVKQFTFKLLDDEACGTVSVEPSKGSPVEGKIRLYPLPADQSVVLEWSFVLQQSANIEIYNSHGVFQEKISVPTGEGNQKRIATGTWSPGIYYITLGNSAFKYVAKLVKI